jgi:hypothetical protein
MMPLVLRHIRPACFATTSKLHRDIASSRHRVTSLISIDDPGRCSGGLLLAVVMLIRATTVLKAPAAREVCAATWGLWTLTPEYGALCY